MSGPGKIVVSDTTAITYLSRIGAISLLKSLFNQIYIPLAVYEELTRQGDSNPGSEEVKTLNWIVVNEVSNFKEVTEKFSQKLDPGESQAIGLALEKKASLLIIDEKAGRAEAQSLGIPITGMVGVLLKAKERNLISTVAPFLNRLRQTNFKMGPALYNRALELAGEANLKLNIEKKA
ncbi:DUF3368 domain-containing protein [Microbulbifer sp.]|uniref:DUF3368 domain-containing protein n=1 Tax=Microbulbifer sp. TaxID=1908541 RepID=UPI002584D5EB|nr:DUF3368 domain-containing protein [Microbulbifer sp.]